MRMSTPPTVGEDAINNNLNCSISLGEKNIGVNNSQAYYNSNDDDEHQKEIGVGADFPYKDSTPNML